ncbi:hypothetical protein [Moraxella equi]|uniref:DUF2059 domain-containing protein n=1 Tax=Moraxella equi TaxID=60442 RepID=A0A378QQI6_9GAMM|nr:hypothetical protein [Moraxella equi]OPH35786.1 hypothetical protein B5J93_10210 [Moraxella equi]STZ02732.1 Uncharacterised protein [Moraxella equi]
MKKYLLGVCLALSMQATAYDGATMNFTKSIFDKIVTHVLMDGLQERDTAKQACAINIATSQTKSLAENYVNTALTKDELPLMDEFFDTSLGQDMIVWAEFGDMDDIDDIDKVFDFDKYPTGGYEKYQAVMDKYFDSDMIEQVFSDDVTLLRAFLASAVKCNIFDSE